LDRKQVGYIVGAVVLLGFCRALWQAPMPKQPDKSEVPATGAAASPMPPKPRRTELPDLAKHLGAIIAAPAQYATNKDVDKETVTYDLKPFAGFSTAMFIGYRNNQKAWRFQLEFMPCDDIDQLGLEVTELERAEAPIGHGYFNAWYEVTGGPLSGCWVKVHSKSIDEPNTCVVMPGTPPFWQTRRGDMPKGKTR